jgi:hypothetical protein
MNRHDEQQLPLDELLNETMEVNKEEVVEKSVFLIKEVRDRLAGMLNQDELREWMNLGAHLAETMAQEGFHIEDTVAYLSELFEEHIENMGVGEPIKGNEEV